MKQRVVIICLVCATLLFIVTIVYLVNKEEDGVKDSSAEVFGAHGMDSAWDPSPSQQPQGQHRTPVRVIEDQLQPPTLVNKEEDRGEDSSAEVFAAQGMDSAWDPSPPSEPQGQHRTPVRVIEDQLQPLTLPGSDSDIAFPPEFIIGAASASYQVEGAWNTDGKGESIWDHLVHNHPEKIKNNASGDIACDSYHKYKEDVQLIKDIGFYHYRFSISWPRILPTGHDNVINKAGVEYYHRLIDELLQHGIQPMVTMYHWDLPQPLQELGGWANPLMAKYFQQYARVLFTEYASKVKWWITLNEPFQIAQFGYGVGIFAPGVNQLGVADLLASHTLLQAHARAYHLYKSSFQQQSPDKQGQIGISIHAMFFIPLTNSEADRQAASRAKAFEHDIYAHPIFSREGDYPAIVKELVRVNSAREGRSESRLPVFTDEEIKLLRGSSDFFGLNHYTTKLVTTGVSRPESVSFFTDAEVLTSSDPSWPTSASVWLQSVPSGIRGLLNQLKEDYNNIPVLITENGWSSDSSLEDTGRVQYYHDYLEQILKAKKEDGCNIIGYTAWSIMDNFEWLDGYEARFGINYVNFEDPNRPRTMKKSAKYFKTLLQTRQLPSL